MVASLLFSDILVVFFVVLCFSLSLGISIDYFGGGSGGGRRDETRRDETRLQLQYNRLVWNNGQLASLATLVFRDDGWMDGWMGLMLRYVCLSRLL